VNIIGRKWTNSKGVGVDQEKALKRSIQTLEREVIKPKDDKKKQYPNKGKQNNKKKY